MTDYGLNPVYDVLGSERRASNGATGETRWKAPELLDNRAAVMQSKPADIFAFGILAWEVLTGKVAFERMSDIEALLRIIEGYRPVAPDGSVGDLIKECWAQDPESRPKIEEVVRRLK